MTRYRFAYNFRLVGHIIGLILAVTIGFFSHLTASYAYDLNQKQFGVRIGGHWSLLKQPQDQAGSPTLLHGSAFSGAGFTFGGALNYPLNINWSIDTQLLYNYSSITGYAEQPRLRQRQTIKLTSHQLQIPALATFSHKATESIILRAGLGPKLILGLRSQANVHYENIDERPETLHTKAGSALAFTTGFGLLYILDNIPISSDIQFTWNPWVKDTTLERFDNYFNSANPGRYTVSHNVQLLILAGFGF